MTSAPYHVPVLAEAVAALARGRRRGVDATVGGGGHAARLQALGLTLLCIDRDPAALAHARRVLAGDPPARFLHAAFGDPAARAAVAAWEPDVILLDLGVSSRQLDDDARGFSFRPGIPLDMRMNPEVPGTAADWLNTAPLPELERAFRDFGDERRSRRLATAVAERRPLAVSDDLVGAIRRALGPHSGAPDFARLFQAVRIAVNAELEQLGHALPALRDALVPDGQLAVITYHSGEDRLVKHAFREWARACVCPPGQPVCTCRGRPLGRAPKPVTAAEAEVRANPRARSARLRVFARGGDGA